MPEVPLYSVGTWEKLEGPPCAAAYPDTLKIEPDGLYRGEASPRRFLEWDEGRVRLIESGRLTISTANDAIVTYSLQIEGDTITFTNPEGCVFVYWKVS